MRKSMILIYGVTCYAVGLASLLYMIGWLGNLWVPQSIDSTATSPFLTALLFNSALFFCFAVQHSVMARPAFKRWLTTYIPESAERSTYVLCSGLALSAIMYFWRPMGIEIWNITNPLAVKSIYAIYAAGWVILVGSTFALNHFDLFGLRQVWLQARNKPYAHLDFATPGPYRMVRHPIYVGWITLAWATPTMSLAHLAFATATTVYILVAIQLEERDLIGFHGQKYEDYRAKTPMLVPRFSTQDDKSQSSTLTTGKV